MLQEPVFDKSQRKIKVRLLKKINTQSNLTRYICGDEDEICSNTIIIQVNMIKIGRMQYILSRVQEKNVLASMTQKGNEAFIY